MLHKSFKPAKCKTSLKLATSRIKLLKNKKGIQITQMKRELAQLLESGQERTARIRVEHVIREEKMVAAYDLIEIYCEVIAARLPIIESQKKCPIDLKEAITSLIFASPRCSDIPELLDIRKHFTAKYGKEFVTAAIELRPDCGVSRMLIEKLSAVAPDLKTKIKTLSAAAEENNIKWDPEAFEEKESKPPDDLLNGPSTFGNASGMHANPPQFSGPHVVAHSYEQKQYAHTNLSQDNGRSSLGPQNFGPMDSGGVGTSSVSSHTDMRSTGRTSERAENRQSFPRDGHDYSSGKQNWNLEFKDATSAAQAAAESAERASMAARAAAELSRQHSAESHKSNSRDKGPQSYYASEVSHERHSRDSPTSSFSDRITRVQNLPQDRTESTNIEKAAKRFNGDDQDGIKKPSRSDSLRSRKGSNAGKKFVQGYSRESSFVEKTNEEEENPFFLGTSPNHDKESKLESRNSLEDGFNYENHGFGEVIGKQSSIGMHRSHSNAPGDEFNVSTSDNHKLANNTFGDPFVYPESIHSKTPKTASYVDDATSDYEADSDDGGPRFGEGPKYDEREEESFSPSPFREPANANIWSPRMNTSEAVETSASLNRYFSEKHSFSKNAAKFTDSSELDSHVSVAFDVSDGPDSDDEVDLDRLGKKQDFHSESSEPELADNHELGSSFSRGGSGFDRTTHSDDVIHIKMAPESSRRSAENSEKFSSGKPRVKSTDMLEKESYSHGHEFKDTIHIPVASNSLEDAGFSNQSNSETGKELNLQALTGGLRHKSYIPPPYTKRPVPDASSLSEKPVERTATSSGNISLPSVRTSKPSTMSRMENRGATVPDASSDSSSDDSSKNIPLRSSQRASKEVKNRSKFEPPVSFLNDDSDSEEDIVPKKTSPSRFSSGTGLSWRTKASPSGSLSRARDRSEAKTVDMTPDADSKPSRISYINDTSPELRSRPGKSMKEASQSTEDRTPTWRTYRNETPVESPAPTKSSNKQEAFKPIPESNVSNRGERSKSESVESSSSLLNKTAGSGGTETAKSSNLSWESSSGEGSVKKPSHVHPKLPDYDSLAARLQSIRANQK